MTIKDDAGTGAGDDEHLDDTEIEPGHEDADGQGEGSGQDEDDGDTAEDIDRAKRLGWVPPEEWKGARPPKHGLMSAKEYIDRGEQLLPLAIARNNTLDKKLADAERMNRELVGRFDEASKRLEEVGGVVRTLHKQNVDTAKRAYEKARADLLEEQVTAAGEANPDRVRQIQSQLDELDKTRPTGDVGTDDDDDDVHRRRTPKKGGDDDGRNDDTTKPKVSEAARAWVDANKWFNADPLLNGVAIALHDANLKSGMSEEDSFAELADQVKERFPEKFENGARRRAPAVGRSNGGRPPPKKTKSFDDLPKESKDAYSEIVKHDKNYTKEQYLKDYMWD